MIQKDVVVNLKYGLHARIATLFVQKASSFSSDIDIIKQGKTANAKSIMGIMAMGIPQGETVTLSASGDDEREAINALAKILQEEE